LKTALKIVAAVLVVLVTGTAVAGLLLPDSVLRSVTGPLGDKAVHAKHAANDAIKHGFDNAIYSAKSVWWSLTGDSDDNSASKAVIDLPEALRRQFGKGAPAEAEGEQPTLKTAAAEMAPAGQQPAAEAKPDEIKPEPAPAASPEPKAEMQQPAMAEKPAAEAMQKVTPPPAEPAHQAAAQNMAPPPPPPPMPEPKPMAKPEPKPMAKPEPKPAPKPMAKHEEAAKPEPKPAAAQPSQPMPMKETASTTGDAGTADHKKGLAFYKGEGVPKDFRKAAEWFEKAAAKGHAGAQYNLGIMAYLGQGTGKDFATAAKWFREAAEQGHAAAQYNLGFLYYEGKGVPKDDLQAYTWIDRAANQGHEKAQTARDALAKALPKDIFKSK
jgi:TPR repeat protein